MSMDQTENPGLGHGKLGRIYCSYIDMHVHT